MLSGYKTYISAGIALLAGAASLAGVDMSGLGIDHSNAVVTIWQAFSLAFIRHGVGTATAL